jgi:hypothetical protein
MARPVVTVAVEGLVDQAALARVLGAVGLDVGPVHGLRGKGYLDRQLQGFNNAARYAPWIVLRDLDSDASCAPQLIEALLPTPAQWMRFRLAVREVESWLLADPTGISDYFSVPITAIPADPDRLSDPKREVLAMMRKSRSGEVRRDMVAEDDNSAIGPGYTARMIEFATTHWRPRQAQDRSPSLKRAIRCLRTLARDLRKT